MPNCGGRKTPLPAVFLKKSLDFTNFFTTFDSLFEIMAKIMCWKKFDKSLKAKALPLIKGTAGVLHSSSWKKLSYQKMPLTKIFKILQIG